MRYLFTFICFLIVALCFGQIERVEGRVVTENGDGIPFSTIGIPKKNFGTVAFEDGTFSIKVSDTYKNDTLIVSALGFERKKIAYADLLTNKITVIPLKENVQELDEIVVTPTKVKYKWMGGAGLKFLYSDPLYLRPRNGSTLAALFDRVEEPLWLKEITVKAGGEHMESFLLRCRVFSVRDDSYPGEELLDVDLIKDVKENGEVKFVLENEMYIDQPFFVGFEWVMSKDHYKKIEEVYEQFPLTFLDEMTKEYRHLDVIISNNRRLLLRDSLSKLRKTLKIPKEGRNELKERDKVRPVVYYLCSPTGPRTVSGSYITGKWSDYFLHADVSVLVGRIRED